MTATASRVEPIQFFTDECLIDEILLCLASIKHNVTNDQGRTLRVPKYYSQACVLQKYIAVAKPTPKFVIKRQDLTPEITRALKMLPKLEAQIVLKRAVGRLFENLSFRLYHL